MKKIVLIAFYAMLHINAYAQDYQAIAKKVKLITNADAEFINVKKSISEKVTTPSGKEVEIAEGLIMFDNAEVLTFSPGTSDVDEWLYNVDFKPAPNAKSDFLELSRALNTALSADDYQQHKERPNAIVYFHKSKPTVFLYLEEKDNQSRVQLRVIQDKAFFENPKNKDVYFNPKHAAAPIKFSTDLGIVSMRPEPLFRLNAEQYTLNFEKLKKVKGTPTEDCPTSGIRMYLIRKERTYWFATSCFTGAFYKIKENKLFLTKYSPGHGEVDEEEAKRQQNEGTNLPADGLEAQKKAIELYAKLIKDSANYDPNNNPDVVDENRTIPINISIDEKYLTYTDYNFSTLISGFDQNGFARFKKDGKNGFFDNTGKLVIPAEYDNTAYFSEGLCGVQKNGKWGFINASNELIVPFIYDKVRKFKDGLAAVQKHGRWGYIDKSGNEVIPKVYADAKGFYEGLAAVKSGYKWGYIDKTGKKVIPTIFSDAYAFSEGLASAKKEGQPIIINKKGETFVPPQYSSIGVMYKFGIISARNQDKKYGAIDKEGTVCIPLIYNDIGDKNEGFVSVKQESGRGFVNFKGQVVVPLIYKSTQRFTEGLAAVKKDKKWGFVNTVGEVVIPIIYDSVRPFTDGLSAVEKDGKWGFIDKTGTPVIPFVYDNVRFIFGPGGSQSFMNGHTIVSEDGKVVILKNPLKGN